MTNEEAKVFLDNLKICIDEHPIVADWLVEIADRKTEPTISKMEQVEDEPRTELVNDSPILVKDLVDDEFNPYDEECMRCKHLKLKCEFIPTYCKFESRDEPQTDEEYINNLPWTEVGNGEQTDDVYCVVAYVHVGTFLRTLRERIQLLSDVSGKCSLADGQ